MGEANEVIKEVHSLMCNGSEKYDDVVLAAHSDLGWNIVRQFRGDFGSPDGCFQGVKDLKKLFKSHC